MKALSRLFFEIFEEGLLDVETEKLVQFVIELEEEMGTMDFTEPLYQHFKKIMEKEDPAGL